MFLSMTEYLTIASKMLSLYGYNCHKNDEDAISSVATAMMNADATWDGIQTSRKTWRFIQARYAIQKLCTKTRKQRKMISLHKEVGVHGKKITYLHEILPEKTPLRQLIANERVGDVIESAKKLLNEKQYACLTMYYLDGQTLEAIGQYFDISRERVRQIIAKALRVLKNEHQTQANSSTS